MKELKQQIAAMPLRWKGDSVQVLMVTTRDTGRWIVPKGWTMKDMKPWAAAAAEAMEEAGVSGHVGKDVFGTFTYDKRLDDGGVIPCLVHVYPMIVKDEHKRWKEKSERKRAWFDVTKAAKLVDEPELADLLRLLAKKPKKVPVVGPILKRAAS